MSNTYRGNKATVCNGNNCVTVYGDAVKIIEGITITTVALLAIALLNIALE
jgi:hypothetical protein